MDGGDGRQLAGIHGRQEPRDLRGATALGEAEERAADVIQLGVDGRPPPAEAFRRLAGGPAAAEDIHDVITWVGEKLDEEIG